MKSGDALKVTWHAMVDVLEARKEIVADDRGFLTEYKGKLGTATTVKEDLHAIQIVKKYFNRVVY